MVARARGEVGREVFLDGDEPGERHLVGQIGDAEAAGPQHALDAVVADQLRPVRQSQQVRIGRRAWVASPFPSRPIATSTRGSNTPQLSWPPSRCHRVRTPAAAAKRNGRKVRAIMWQNDGAGHGNCWCCTRVPCRWPCSCRHAPARLLLKELEMPPAHIPAAVARNRPLGGTVPRGFGVGRGRAGAHGRRGGAAGCGFRPGAARRRDASWQTRIGATPSLQLLARARALLRSGLRAGAGPGYRAWRLCRAAGGRTGLLARAVGSWPQGAARGDSRRPAADADAGAVAETPAGADIPLWPREAWLTVEGGDAGTLPLDQPARSHRPAPGQRHPAAGYDRAPLSRGDRAHPGRGVRDHRPERQGRQRHAHQRRASVPGPAGRRRRDRARPDTVEIRECTRLEGPQSALGRRRGP